MKTFCISGCFRPFERFQFLGPIPWNRSQPSVSCIHLSPSREAWRAVATLLPFPESSQSSAVERACGRCCCCLHSNLWHQKQKLDAVETRSTHSLPCSCGGGVHICGGCMSLGTLVLIHFVFVQQGWQQTLEAKASVEAKPLNWHGLLQNTSAFLQNAANEQLQLWQRRPASSCVA